MRGRSHRTHVVTVDDLCDSVLSQTIGLMFAREPRALLMTFRHARRISLHMWFVFFPIDVLLLDDGFRVVEALANFKPWTTHTFGYEARHVVELPAGTLRAKKIKCGDIVHVCVRQKQL